MRLVVTCWASTYLTPPSVWYTPRPKNISADTLSCACSFIADPRAAPPPKGFSSLPEVARSRDRTSLLVTILPFTPAPDNSPGILGLPVDCRLRALLSEDTQCLCHPRPRGGRTRPRGRRVSRLRARNRDPSDKRVGRRGAPFCRFYFGAGAADMPAIRIAAQIADNAEPRHSILLKIPIYNGHRAISSSVLIEKRHTHVYTPELLLSVLRIVIGRPIPNFLTQFVCFETLLSSLTSSGSCDFHVHLLSHGLHCSFILAVSISR